MTSSAAPATDFETVIGLEVHAQLATRSKMFCRCSTDYVGAPPNTHVCPVCMGMPGVLPVINARAVELVIMTGLALNCSIPERAKFDRKNYPYPDLMKGYQISEYDMPICVNGWMDVPTEMPNVGSLTSENGVRRIRVQRVHLEEDTARLLHRDDGSGEPYSLVDANRAGMPLMEIVTEPDARSPAEALGYLMKLRQILRYLGVSDANMEEGNFRCEPNLSLRPRGATAFGAKVELKNLNSFRAALRGMEFEVVRQTAILRAGGRVASETRGWREETQETVSQRSKELAHDYRYFPEPDLPPLVISREYVEELRAKIPELPDARRERFRRDYGLSDYEADVLTESRPKADFYEAAVAASGNPVEGPSVNGERMAKAIANWLLGDLSKLLNAAGCDIGESPVGPEQLEALVSLVETGRVSGTAAKEVLEKMIETGRAAASIVEELGLGRIEDTDAVVSAVRKAIEANEKAVADYRAGKSEAVKFLLGQVMRETRGRANASQAQSVLIEELSRASV
jgi:aspartyl-tRNA(Asn)/glutamyl-tRNA(Gln) amidotransferase subunit B